jgi:GT2 family glycosyltransferase
MTPTVSVVFPVYALDQQCVDMTRNAWCLFRAAASGRHPVQWVVVNNGGHVKEVADTVRKDDPTYLEFPEPLGFAGAVNAGLRAATGDYVAVISNDITMVTMDWEARLAEALAADPKAGAVSVGYHDVDRPGDWVRTTHNWACVACFMMTRQALNTVGLLDTSFGMAYFEDTDWLFRAEKAGFSLLKTGRVMVVHAGGATFHKLPAWQDMYAANAVRFREKHGVDGEAWKLSG